MFITKINLFTFGYSYDGASPINAGKLATKGCDDASRCKIIELASLPLFRRSSLARRRAIAALDCPRTSRSSPETVLAAHSKFNVAFKMEEMTTVRSSTCRVCSDGGFLSVATIRGGRMTCMKMGRSGISEESKGVVKTYVTTRRHVSTSPIFAADSS